MTAKPWLLELSSQMSEVRIEAEEGEISIVTAHGDGAISLYITAAEARAIALRLDHVAEQLEKKAKP